MRKLIAILIGLGLVGPADGEGDVPGGFSETHRQEVVRVTEKIRKEVDGGGWYRKQAFRPEVQVQLEAETWDELHGLFGRGKGRLIGLSLGGEVGSRVLTIQGARIIDVERALRAIVESNEFAISAFKRIYSDPPSGVTVREFVPAPGDW